MPDDELIFSIIGEKKHFWLAIIGYTNENYSDISYGWNYYNDGKQWLFKLVQKKKTLFWAAMLSDTFRITFYFGNKAEPFIEESDLPALIKSGFKSAKRYGLIRPISFAVYDQSDVDNVLKLIGIKHKIK